MKKAEIVIVGGGAAGNQLAHVLSRAGTKAVIVDSQPEPVELPPLTDGLFADELTVAPLPVPEGITRIEGTASRVEQGAVHLEGGRVIEADVVVIATGLAPRTAPIAGAHTVSSLESARALREAVLTGAPIRLGVLGSGFLALEIARSAADRGVDVSVHLRGDLPVPHCSPQLGQVLVDINADAGVAFVPSDPAPEPASADVWAAAVGSQPVLPECPWPQTLSGRLAVDEGLQAAPGVYAIGDCAEPVEGPSAGMAEYGAEPQALSQGLWLGQMLTGQTKDSAWRDVPSHWSFQGSTRVFTDGAAYRSCDPTPVVLGSPEDGRGQLLFFSGPDDDSIMLRAETVGMPPAHNAAKRLLAPVLADGLDAIAEGREIPGALTRAEASEPGFDMRKRSRQTGAHAV